MVTGQTCCLQFDFSLLTPLNTVKPQYKIRDSGDLAVNFRQSWMWLIPYPVRVFDFVAMILQNCLLQSSIQLASLSVSLDEAKKALISDSEKKYAVFILNRFSLWQKILVFIKSVYFLCFKDFLGYNVMCISDIFLFSYIIFVNSMIQLFPSHLHWRNNQQKLFGEKCHWWTRYKT